MDENICSICYQSEEKDGVDVRATCSKCKIKLCISCWYDKCKTYCPICSRSDLNREHQCSLCLQYKHLQRISVCSICSKWVCYSCEGDDIHECNDILGLRGELPKVDDTLDIYILHFKAKLIKSTFRVLGYIETTIGKITIIEDINPDGKRMIMIVWDILNNETLFKHVSDQTNMKRYRVDTFKRGIKCYNTYYKHTMKHMLNFVSKMKNYRLCNACNKDIVLCPESNYCRKCHTLKRLFCTWKKLIKNPLSLLDTYQPICLSHRDPDKDFDEYELLCKWCCG
jgi:hypothetical protein